VYVFLGDAVNYLSVQRVLAGTLQYTCVWLEKGSDVHGIGCMASEGADVILGLYNQRDPHDVAGVPHHILARAEGTAEDGSVVRPLHILLSTPRAMEPGYYWIAALFLGTCKTVCSNTSTPPGLLRRLRFPNKTMHRNLPFRGVLLEDGHDHTILTYLVIHPNPIGDPRVKEWSKAPPTPTNRKSPLCVPPKRIRFGKIGVRKFRTGE
jgi:hypothetical protein